MRRARLSIAVLAAGVAGVLPTAFADARAGTRCPSADLRYAFHKGGPKTFGVFKLRIDGGSCATARGAAKAWMTALESALAKGKVKLPDSAAGFAFEKLRATQAQAYNERGTKGSTTVRFQYVVPNG